MDLTVQFERFPSTFHPRILLDRFGGAMEWPSRLLALNDLLDGMVRMLPEYTTTHLNGDATPGRPAEYRFQLGAIKAFGQHHAVDKDICFA